MKWHLGKFWIETTNFLLYYLINVIENLHYALCSDYIFLYFIMHRYFNDISFSLKDKWLIWRRLLLCWRLENVNETKDTIRNWAEANNLWVSAYPSTVYPSTVSTLVSHHCLRQNLDLKHWCHKCVSKLLFCYKYILVVLEYRHIMEPKAIG